MITDSGDSSSDDSSSGGSNAFITILSTGAYRIKGTVNELNVNSIVEGEPVTIHLVWDDSRLEGDDGTSRVRTVHLPAIITILFTE